MINRLYYEAMSKIEKGLWVPLADSEIELPIEVSYSGAYAQYLEINKPLVERFLEISALDGRVLLAESRFKKPQHPPDINPDGSVTRKGGLRWGERPNLEPKEPGNLYYQVKRDSQGYAIALNGDLITEDLLKKPDANARDITEQFARRFDGYFMKGLREILWRDKFTLESDPLLIGRVVGSAFIIWAYCGALINLDFSRCAIIGINATAQYGSNFLHKDDFDDEFKELRKNKGRLRSHPTRLLTFSRRTVKNLPEGFSLPLELDRAFCATIYLEWSRIRRNPLIREKP